MGLWHGLLDMWRWMLRPLPLLAWRYLEALALHRWLRRWHRSKWYWVWYWSSSIHLSTTHVLSWISGPHCSLLQISNSNTTTTTTTSRVTPRTRFHSVLPGVHSGGHKLLLWVEWWLLCGTVDCLWPMRGWGWCTKRTRRQTTATKLRWWVSNRHCKSP